MTRISTFGRLALALALLAGQFVISDSSAQKPLEPGFENYECTHPPYKVHLVSRSPLVIYLADFVTADERAHLQEIA